MKSTTFFALFLLSAFTSYLPSATAQDLLDTDGNPLQNYGIYYILPVIITGNGGGIEHAALGNETCPLTVVQSRDPFCRGFPITISNPSKILYIHEGLNLDIAFTFRPPPCAPTSSWTVVKDQLPEGLAAVTLNWDSNDRVPGWFKIQRVPAAIDGYNILFCPLDDSTCGYVGVEFDQYRRNRRLVLTSTEENRLWVRFQRLSYASTATA